MRQHFWLVNGLIILIIAYFGASATATMVASWLLPPPPRATLTSGPRHNALRGAARRDVKAIIARNVFCSTCEPEEEVSADPKAGDDSGPVSGEPVKSSLSLKLIATMVSAQDRAWSFAAVYDPDADRTGLYAIGSKLPGNAAVEDVQSRRILLRNGRRAEYIELETDDTPRPRSMPTPQVVRAPALRAGTNRFAEEFASGVTKLGPNKWEIRRSALNKVLGSTHLLARQARIVPSVKNNKPDGFKLYAVRPGSVYSLIGLQNGDTIHTINGHEITTPDKALEVYTKVRNANHLSISFSRRGKSTTHDYDIR